MSQYYFVTGSSRGIGRAVVEQLLRSPENKVYGIARSNTIEAANFTFLPLDLSDLQAVSSFTFDVAADARKIVLINNAGMLGELNPVGKLNAADIEMVLRVNSVSPAVLMNTFIARFQHTEAEKTIINISSGAGRHTIHSWSSYCASKAALDMFSLVADEEQQRFASLPIRLFSVAPGIVDTAMQSGIRTTAPEAFADVQKFVGYHNKQLLSPPKVVAKQLIDIAENPDKYPDTICDLRELNKA